ncbi:aquaporin-like protein [Cytidiella melzeri]|nr:aquaporin-like protein [Cytidiella melzeri]
MASKQVGRSGLVANAAQDLQAAILEFFGTVTFLTLAFGGVQASAFEARAQGIPSFSVDRVMYISLSFGLSLLVSTWLFFRVTGGLFNPNVSLALLITGVIGPLRFVLYCIAQLVGGIVAAALVLALTPGSLQSNTYPGPGVNPAQAVFIEAFITAALCLAVLMLAAEKHNATPFAPVGIGLTLLACHLFAVNFTGAGMNTARSFGPAAVTGFPYGTQWIYWVGPGIGSLVASTFYVALKQYKYWTLNPGADETDVMQSPPNPVSKVASRRSQSRGSRTRNSQETRSNGILEQDLSNTNGSGYPNNNPV